MTTIAPIDVDEAEAAAVIDLENIRLSWEKKYGRLFQYTDLCWLCELAESRFRTSIGRVVIFMSNPSECETVCHEAFVEVKRILKYLKEDEARTANRPIPSSSLAAESNIGGYKYHPSNRVKGRHERRYLKPSEVQTVKRHSKAVVRSTDPASSEVLQIDENFTRDSSANHEGAPPSPIQSKIRRSSTASNCSSITSSSSESSLEEYSYEGLRGGNNSDSSIKLTINGVSADEHTTPQSEDTTPEGEPTSSSEESRSFVSLLQKGRENSLVVNSSSEGCIDGSHGRRDRIEIDVEDDDEEDDDKDPNDDDDDEVLEISHLSVPTIGKSRAIVADHCRWSYNILSSNSLPSKRSLGRPNNHGYWGIEGFRHGPVSTGCEDGEVVFAPGSKRRRYGNGSPSVSQGHGSPVKETEVSVESKSSSHPSHDSNDVGVNSPPSSALLPTPAAAAMGCSVSELPSSVDTISCVSDSEASCDTTSSDTDDQSGTGDESGSSTEASVAPQTGDNNVDLNSLGYSVANSKRNLSSGSSSSNSIGIRSDLTVIGSSLDHGITVGDGRSASNTTRHLDLPNLQTARQLPVPPGLACVGDRRKDCSGCRSDTSSHRRRWSRRRPRGTEAPKLVNLCRSEDEATQQLTVRNKAASGVATSDSDSGGSVADDSPPEIRFGASACPNAAVVVKVFGYKLSGSRRVQRCCDVSIGTEITKLCFSPRFSSIILFSADSDFDETARSCAEAEDVGGVIKYAKPIRIMGYASAFSNAASMAARRAFELRRAEVLRRRALSNRGPVLLHHNSPNAGVTRQFNGRDPDDDSDLLPTFSTHLIDLEFPIIHKLLSRSSRPLLPLDRWRRHYPYHYSNKNTSRVAPSLPQTDGVPTLPSTSMSTATLSTGASFPPSSSSTPIPAATAAISAAISTAAVPSGLIGNASAIPSGIPALRQVAAQGGLA